MTLSKLKILDDNFHLVTFAKKKCNGDKLQFLDDNFYLAIFTKKKL